MKKYVKIFITILLIILLMIVVLFLFREKLFVIFFAITPTTVERGASIKDYNQLNDLKTGQSSPKNIDVVADKLMIPWELAFLPSGALLVTERPGTLKRIGKEGGTYSIEGVKHIGEGGLLGLALHPNFSENKLIYLYLTTKSPTGLINRVERYKFSNDTLSDKQIIIDNIPGAVYHDGGRIAFGPDGYLYITVGDAGKPKLAQDLNSLSGKILRLKEDGTVPADNPFNNSVYSLGHRNPQGLAWDDKGMLWATEHGPKGYDELNLIEKGKNYGWPIIKGNETSIGLETPVIHSGPDETWAPAGLAYLNGSLFFGGLRGQSLYKAKIEKDNKVTLKSHFRLDFGRIRAVKIGPDNNLYFGTSNTDKRGKVNLNDDKIIKINPAILLK